MIFALALICAIVRLDHLIDLWVLAAITRMILFLRSIIFRFSIRVVVTIPQCRS